MNQKQLIERVHAFFKSIGWTYDFNEEQSVFYTGCQLDCRLRNCRLVVDVQDEILQCYAFAVEKVEAARRPAVIEFVTRANWGFKRGAFECDLTDGEVRYHTYVDCPEGAEMPHDDVLRSLVFVPTAMLEQYGDMLLEVIDGTMTPAEAVAKAEGDDESEAHESSSGSTSESDALETPEATPSSRALPSGGCGEA
ncbi:YbjN domain-containing protein [Sutterella megalosphaeroides]|uniref:YbjN domain-containing protein n=1 Tax=Sutterella megalosphaeroides TaxID=2494234 RepID=A0A2Z6IBF0_9BURK|nr:YbjN domain-containing protein [Sutterella megalosphaeroides]BBF23813.1 hypothetical protein SUTMEG_17040 [Sutterella megalosphaeroides]